MVRLKQTALILIVSLSLFACGKKGDIEPPQRHKAVFEAAEADKG